MIVSIDIGTSYSSICMLGPDGKAHPVDISTGASMFGSKYSLPSAVFVEDSGNVLVGQAAMNSRKHRPQNFRMEFKRNLGEDIPILLGERSFKPEELYTELFRHMKVCAEKVSGEAVEKAYLTYPASYGERRREKLRSASKAAGLFDLALVDEPTAAAMCYCVEGYIKDGQTLLVYDFGGGTFEVSLIKYRNHEFQLLSEPMGLERCGGMDIDYLIAQDMREVIEREIPGAWDSLQKNQSRFQRFTSQINELAVKAKHHLSSAGVFEEYIEMGMDDVPYKLTVERFNEMIAPLVGQTLQLCRQALDEAGISASDVSAVLMVGGTSRIPLVREMAQKITGKPPLCAADLELAVVQGALMYNEYRKQDQDKKRQEAEARTKAQREKAERETAEARRKAQDAEGREKASREAEAYEKAQRGQVRTQSVAQRKIYPESVQLYRKAADRGLSGAMIDLGICYEKGQGVTQDYGQAVQWYLKAAESGSSDAMNNLGICYENGQGVMQDYNRAIQWYLKAAESGNSDAMNNLGACCEDGHGVPKDRSRAIYWYQEAANLGNKKAKQNLKRLTAESLGLLIEEFIDTHNISRYFGKTTEYFEERAIHSLKKLKAGLKIPSDEKVLLAHNTVWITKDKGTIVTNRGIYCRPGGFDVGYDRVDFTPWLEFKTSVIKIEANGSIWDILDNGNYISLGVADSWNQFWPDLQKFLCSLDF